MPRREQLFDNDPLHSGSPVRSGLVSLVVKVSAAISAFLVNLVLARMLGANDAGLFFLSVSIIAILSVVSRLGLGPVVTRFIARDHSAAQWHRINALVRLALTVIFVVSATFTVAVFLNSERLGQFLFQKPELARVLPTLSLSIIPLSLTFLFSHAFQGKHQINRCLLFQQFGVSVLFLMLLCVPATLPMQMRPRLDLGLAGTAYTSACYALLGAAVITWYFDPRTRLPAAHSPIGEIRQDALAFFGIAVLGLVTQHAGQLLLGAFSSTADVAIYAIALRIAGLITLVLAAFNAFALPRFSALHHKADMDNLKILAKTVTRAMVIICLPIILVICAFPEKILALFGAEFVAGNNALRILAIGQFFNVATGSVGALLVMTGHARFSFYSSLIAAGTMVLLGVLLIPQYGVPGAAITQALSLSIQMALNTIAVRKYLGFTPLNIFRGR